MGVLKSLVSVASVLLLSGSVLGETTQPAPSAATALTSNSGRYIVKFSQTGSAKFRKRDGSTDSDAFYDKLQETGGEATPALSFDSELFHGASFDLNAADNQTVADIEALDEVERIWPAAYMTIPVSGSAVVQDSSKSSYPAWTAHNDTKVAKMHALGYYGEDVIIALVDSGIDYTHEAFGGGFGEGFRVDAGYDLVGNDYVVGGEYIPDDDPMDCLGHGTHVAGIAASGDEYVPGVAPKARIRSYKVFGCEDGTYEDVIVAGFLRAYEEGADVISASLGSNRGFADTPTAEVATAIQAKGALVLFAAGNSGDMGPFYTSSGGNGFESTTVGSVQASDWVAYSIIATSSGGEEREIVYLSDRFLPFNLNGTVPASIQTGARELDACNWDLESTADDSVMIIPFGDCGWQLQDSTLIGKTRNVFYVQTEGADWERVDRAVYREDQPQGSAVILYDDGDWLFTQAENGHDVTFEFIQDDKAIAIPRTGFADGRINDFSSEGPTLDGRMKPEISAPGGYILSTWPVSQGSWAVYSGTSMATPYIAGVGALFFGSRGGRAAMGAGGAKIAHERMIASGKPVRHNDGTDNFASVAKQGAGLIDAEKVLLYSTFISPANVNLNDTVNFKGTHEVKVTNSGDESITYIITHEAGITSHTKGNGDAWVSFEPSYSAGTGNVAEVSFSTESLTVGAGETKTLTLTFTEPETISASMLPVYGGGVVLVGDNGEVVRVTYMGIKGSIYASDSWEMERGVPLFFSGYGGLVEEGHVYTFEEGTDVPQAYFNLLWSSWEFSFDFVSRDWQPSDWTYPTVPGENNWHGAFRLVPSALSGEVVDFPLQQYPRFNGGTYAAPQGFFANGTKIPSGDYKILGRTLRTGGDPANIDDWQYKTSDWFRITRDPVSNSTATTTVASSTTAEASSTTAAITNAAPSCDATSTPVSLSAYVGDEEEAYGFYIYSNFLAVDYSRSKTHLEWKFVDNSHLQTEVGDVTVYASVHTNTNSLVYLYQTSSIAGSWSFLECTETDGELTCVSNSKTAFYICETGDALVRHGTAPLDGCTPLKFKIENLIDCGAATTTASTDVSTSATSVTESTPGTFGTPTSSYTSLTSSVATSVTLTTPGTSDVTPTFASETLTSTSGSQSEQTTPMGQPTSSDTYTPSQTPSASESSASTDAQTSTTSDDSTISQTSDVTQTPSISETSSASQSSGVSTETTLSQTSSSSSSQTSSQSSGVSSDTQTSSVSTDTQTSGVSSDTQTSTTSHGSASSSEGASGSATSTASESSGPSQTEATSDSAAYPTTTTSDSTSHVTSSVEMTTSTAYVTNVVTITACPSSVNNCPVISKTTYVTTETIAIGTTVCPVSEVAEETQTSKAAAHSYSDAQFTTSTVFSTNVATVTACPSTVPNCPASAQTTFVTTNIVAVSTTICPVEEATESSHAETYPTVKVVASEATASASFSAGQAFTPYNSVIRISTQAASSTVEVPESAPTGSHEDSEGQSTKAIVVSSIQLSTIATQSRAAETVVDIPESTGTVPDSSEADNAPASSQSGSDNAAETAVVVVTGSASRASGSVLAVMSTLAIGIFMALM